MNDTLTIAVSKGRIFKDTLPLLARAGIRFLLGQSCLRPAQTIL